MVNKHIALVHVAVVPMGPGLVDYVPYFCMGFRLTLSRGCSSSPQRVENGEKVSSTKLFRMKSCGRKVLSDFCLLNPMGTYLRTFIRLHYVVREQFGLTLREIFNYGYPLLLTKISHYDVRV